MMQMKFTHKTDITFIELTSKLKRNILAQKNILHLNLFN